MESYIIAITGLIVALPFYSYLYGSLILSSFNNQTLMSVMLTMEDVNISVLTKMGHTSVNVN